MKAAIIYARYSSSSQTEQSIEGQVRVCREFAETAAKKRTTRTQGFGLLSLGGESGIRTRAAVSHTKALAGPPLRPLE